MRQTSFPVKLFLIGFGIFAGWNAVSESSPLDQFSSEEKVQRLSKPETPLAGNFSAPCLGSQDLHSWISEARQIMEEHSIPGSYYWICRNIERESGGNPSIVNDWDINAQNGVPSIGLLQVIKPTFEANWEPEFGVPNDQYDPVANIVVACNYAAHRYGSIDNVDGPY